jgi:hypothetical protein
MTSIGIKGIGVPCGKKWARDDFILWRKPRITAPAQSGIVIPRFIDSCVVGVKEYGKSPSRLVDPMKIISEISIKDQIRPLELCIVIICLVISLITHCWMEVSRLLINRFGPGNIILGKRITKVTIGSLIIVGVMKEVNRFSFIFSLKGFLVL